MDVNTVCSMYEWKQICSGFILFAISVLSLTRGVYDTINRINVAATFLCLSQASTWIYIIFVLFFYILNSLNKILIFETVQYLHVLKSCENGMQFFLFIKNEISVHWRKNKMNSSMNCLLFKKKMYVTMKLSKSVYPSFWVRDSFHSIPLRN